MQGDALMIKYHDEEWGVPIRDDARVFEFLVLEAFQAGLSWRIILRKRENFRRAFASFDVDKVARFTARDVARLMADAGIVRNRAKIEAVIENARRVAALRKSHGSFRAWLDAHHPRSKNDWVALFKKEFRFTGGEITGSFLLSTGYLRGAHAPTCPVHARILKRNPPWARARRT